MSRPAGQLSLPRRPAPSAAAAGVTVAAGVTTAAAPGVHSRGQRVTVTVKETLTEAVPEALTVTVPW